ncbi:MAG TPA: FAD-binding oxidoreductase [Agitococcus sp.]|nr:FAD-binding oxidoreductase [Agitococcus sp.]HNC85298.1 FAD-binding oxidoreductase [Agitococcus sp.]HNE90268.1 FAD-binding oxidoreductase [Agitococcus sp.]HNG09813.1 FAD-binding oxidoreductase [Agitococcus sp.]HNG46230.1 FAD-binding oxidoreductase [Agitococcus sp.]
MRQWNSWGDSETKMAINAKAAQFLQELIGQSTALADATLAEVMAKVPVTRLPKHPLISIDAEDRVRHARGQSLPDWLAWRSGEIPVFPDGVAFPTNSQQVAELLALAKTHNWVVIPYGGGTSVVGHINPIADERPILTLSLARLNQLIALDEASQLATIGAGANGPQVEALLKPHGYTLGHYPQSFELSTLGGWIASRSSGQQSLHYGRIEQLFAGGRVETLEGTLDIPTMPASSAGPDIREIIMGSEGRFGVITEAVVRVSRTPNKEVFCVYFVPDWAKAKAAVRELVQQKIPLSMVRLSNGEETRTQLILAGHALAIAGLEKVLNWRGVGAGKCMLTIGFTGSDQRIKFARNEVTRILKEFDCVATGQVLGKRWAQNRFRAPYLREALWYLGYAVDTLETAVDWHKVTPYMTDVEQALRSALQDENEHVLAFSHLSHVYGQGSSIYTTYVYRVAGNYQQTYARWQKLKAAASAQIIKHGGTISHQHGVGQDHAPYLPAEKGVLGMSVLKTLASHFDVDKRLNPHKLLED